MSIITRKMRATAGGAKLFEPFGLDDGFPPQTRIDLITMDIQGAEYQALKGAERVLRENAQLYLVVEFWPWGLVRAGCRPGTVARLLLRDLGFSLVAFDERDPASVACAEGGVRQSSCDARPRRVPVTRARAR